MPPGVLLHHFDCRLLRRGAATSKIGHLIRPLWWLYFQLLALFLGRRIARREEVLLFYGYEIMGVPAAWLLGRLLKRPTVSRFQGTVLAPWLDHPLWHLRWWHHVLALKTPTDLVIMTNDGTQGDRVLQALRVNTARVRFWMNGVPSPVEVHPKMVESLRQQLGCRPEEKLLVTVSRLQRWKRVDRAIRALAELAAERNDVRLVVVGDGPERPHLERLARSLGIAGRVVFVGSVARTLVPLYLEAADVFLSLYDLSNVGNPLLEAMRQGCCVVTLNVGATGEFLQDGVNAILLDPEEIQRLPAVLSALVDDPQRRQELGQAAWRFARDHIWTPEERMAAELREVGQLIGQPEPNTFRDVERVVDRLAD